MKKETLKALGAWAELPSDITKEVRLDKIADAYAIVEIVKNVVEEVADELEYRRDNVDPDENEELYGALDDEYEQVSSIQTDLEEVLENWQHDVVDESEYETENEEDDGDLKEHESYSPEDEDNDGDID